MSAKEILEIKNPANDIKIFTRKRERLLALLKRHLKYIVKKLKKSEEENNILKQLIYAQNMKHAMQIKVLNAEIELDEVTQDYIEGISKIIDDLKSKIDCKEVKDIEIEEISEEDFAALNADERSNKIFIISS